METAANVKAWIEDWCNLWPEDIQFNGYKLKSKPKDCINKMIKFCKDNVKFTKSTIFAATTLYLEEQQAKDWAYTKQSTYFISKVGQPSLLESYCEKVLENKEQDPTIYNWGIMNENDFI